MYCETTEATVGPDIFIDFLSTNRSMIERSFARAIEPDLLCSGFRMRRSSFPKWFPFAAVALFAVVVACSDTSSSPSGPSDPRAETFASSLSVDLSQMTERSPKLFVQDLTVGTGAEAVTSRLLSVRYTGWLVNGQQFDSNTNGNPFSFTLGAQQVIAGWDIGVAGMKVGGRRRLVFGSEYGYGPRGSRSIPGNATLVFVVELLGVQ